MALEFTGTYYVFRRLLGPVDSSVRVIRFSCKLMIVVVALALLDPLSGRLFIRDLVNGLGLYVIPYNLSSELYFRHGLVRALGPMEHSILFAAACAWFGTLALCTFKPRRFGASVAGIALIGIWFSQSRGPLLAFAMAMSLAIYYSATKQFKARGKVLGTVVALGIGFVFVFSGNPIATLLRLSGVDAETGWYREAIWETAGPLVLGSPVFGVGLGDEWDWQANGDLVGSSA